MSEITEIPITLKEYKLLLSIAFGTKNYLEEKAINDCISEELCKDMESSLKARLTEFDNL